MTIKPVLPLSLLWAWRRGDGSDVSTLHKCYTRGIWQERRGLARAGLLARLLVWWPISYVAMVAWCTAYNGPTTRRRTGRAIWRQVVEQIEMAVRHSIAPPWYYIFDLWDDDKRKRASLYLNRYETKGGVYAFLKAYLARPTSGLGDKLEFHEICRNNGLPAPSLVMVLDQGAVVAGEQKLPEADLFVKPRKGRGGIGAESWTSLGDGRYRSHAGEELPEPELRAHLARRSQEEPQLVQRRAVNHPDLADLTTGPLTTARMMTVLNEQGEYEFTHAVFRTAVKPESPVDNFHAGGIAAPVDPDSGELGQAVGGGLRGMPQFCDMGLCETHPVTGARIAGRRLPFWREAVELVKRAHRCFPGFAAVGWDVGFTPDGPVLVEGNSAPDLDIIQRCHQRPLGDTRLAAALAFHVRRARASLPPWPVQPAADAAQSRASAGAATPTRIVLVAGSVRRADRVGHHDYLAGCRLLADLLEQTPGVRAVLVRDGWPQDEAVFDGARSIVFYNAGGHKQAHLASPERIERIQRRLDEGAGMVVIHRAAHYPAALADRARAWIGGAHLPSLSGRGHWWTRHRELPEHPVMRGVRPWRIRDGWLNGIQFAEGMGAITPLVWAGRWHRGSRRGGERDVVAWTYERPAGGRAFAFTGLDAHSAWSVPGVRQLMVNGILWSAGLSIPGSGAPCALDGTALESYLTPREPRSRGRRVRRALGARSQHSHAMRP